MKCTTRFEVKVLPVNINVGICKSTNESTIIINIFKLLGSYMFRHQMCHHQGAWFVTLLNYISTIAAIVKIKKVRTGQTQQQHQHTGESIIK